jgi:hypothetical protein
MSVHMIRRVRPAVVASLLGALLLAGCGFRAEGHDTDSGYQLRPSEVPTPPALPKDDSEHTER